MDVRSFQKKLEKYTKGGNKRIVFRNFAQKSKALFYKK
jgi:hypothetical protein